MSKLSDILANPLFQAALTSLKPEVVAAINIGSLLLEKKSDASIAVIDAMAATHLKRLLTERMHPVERQEIEIRLHELLTVLMKLGGL